MPYLRTMLASAVFLLVLVFPAWGQGTPTPNNAATVSEKFAKERSI